MTERFAGRVALVTGGASGIGAATARRLAREGARVMIGDQNEGLGKQVAGELDGRGAFHAVDVSDLDQVQALVDATVQRFGRLDVLVNNAGIGGFGETPDVDPEQWHRVIAVDLHSVFYGCRAGIPQLRRAGGGAIVNTASVSGLLADYGFSAYNAAKGAVVNYTRTLAIDHAHENIRVNAVCPGMIKTALSALLTQNRRAMDEYARVIPMGRVGEADEVADVVAFLASEDARYVTGQCIAIDGGLTSHTGQPNFTRIFREMIAARKGDGRTDLGDVR
jgi:meso-butanediol dehydrogenase/(S,S)-butanediol dehydrogenase/diacetyl reductase